MVRFRLLVLVSRFIFPLKVLSFGFEIQILSFKILTLRAWTWVLRFSKIDFGFKLIFLSFLKFFKSKLTLYPNGLKDKLKSERRLGSSKVTSKLRPRG